MERLNQAVQDLLLISEKPNDRVGVAADVRFKYKGEDDDDDDDDDDAKDAYKKKYDDNIKQMNLNVAGGNEESCEYQRLEGQEDGDTKFELFMWRKGKYSKM